MKFVSQYLEEIRKGKENGFVFRQFLEKNCAGRTGYDTGCLIKVALGLQLMLTVFV